jgi:hypothetical protein
MMKTPVSRPQTPLAKTSSQPVEGSIVTAKQSDFGGLPLTLYRCPFGYNRLKTLSFYAKKLCPQTKFAAILSL